MSEVKSEHTESERTQRQIERMDALLAQGRAAIAKLDRFYQEHGIQPGIGAQKLQGDDVPDRHRIIFARILAEFSVIDQRIDELDAQKNKPAPVPVGARTLGNRYRI